jgi:hypothetical protein
MFYVSAALGAHAHFWLQTACLCPDRATALTACRRRGNWLVGPGLLSLSGSLQRLFGDVGAALRDGVGDAFAARRPR